MPGVEDRRRGLLLGLALGDALGAPFEGGWLERALWGAIRLAARQRLRWSDDTAMALDVAESLAARGGLDEDDLAQRFAASYRWSRGYGPGAAATLRAIRRGVPWRRARHVRYPEGSFGNGGAMRAPALALRPWRDEEELLGAAARSAEITHAHPEAVEAARLVALASWRLASGTPAREAQSGLSEVLTLPGMRAAWGAALRRVREGPLERGVLPAGMRARDSVPTAVALGLARGDRSFRDLVAEVRRLGGDVDTVGAIAGALFGAQRGASALPADLLRNLEARARIEAAVMDLKRP